MASVSVLAPNGRRQTVKVTPNTTVLQILEEVCKKHNYNVDDYDLKHFNRIVDANSIFRFSGLPNNAQLEMVTCTKIRKVSNVTVGVQLEGGERLTGEFPPTTTLTQILENLYPNVEFETAVIIYMHREVYGKDPLDSTTLRSLGISSGRVMLRLLNRNPEQLKIQAHVYTPPAPKVKPEEEEDAKNSPRRSNVPMMKQADHIVDPLALLKAQKTGKDKSDEPSTNEKKTPAPQTEKSTSKPSKSKTEQADAKETKVEETRIEEKPKVEFIGERNALLFNQAGATALSQEELPDNFFDLTVEDAKTLLRDIKRTRDFLEDAPLVTSAHRKLDQEKRALNQLNKYRQAIVRIQFPNQLVLQGIFSSAETIKELYDFVRKFLQYPEKDFILYTTPPKNELNPESLLIDENLVPSSIVYYSGESELKPELMEKLVDPKDAGLEAIKSRKLLTRNNDESPKLEEMEVDEPAPAANEPVAGPSGASAGASCSNDDGKVPKWFKQSFNKK